MSKKHTVGEASKKHSTSDGGKKHAAGQAHSGAKAHSGGQAQSTGKAHSGGQAQSGGKAHSGGQAQGGGQAVQNVTEILPDGTRHQKITNNQCNSNAGKSQTIETFERPPQLVQDKNMISETLPDGTQVLREVALNRQVHTVKTRHESTENMAGKVVKGLTEYEVEEVVPNTSSAFDAGIDSDYEEERQKMAKNPTMESDMNTIVETLPDGSKHQRQVKLTRVIHLTDNPQGFTDSRRHTHDMSGQEIEPLTSSAFAEGMDSDVD